MKRLLSIGMTFSFLAMLAACSNSSTVAPFHAVPDDAVGVTGTAACRFTDAGVRLEGGPGWRISCELDMSDPRVSGTETTDRYRILSETEYASVWLAEEAVITNAEGKWRGSAQAADDSRPCGEAQFAGEDAYEGLEFRYYFCHVDEPAEVRGWISGGG